MRFPRLSPGVVIFVGLLLACGEKSPPREPVSTQAEQKTGLCATTGMEFAHSYGRVDRISGAFSSPVEEMNGYLMNRYGPAGPRIVSPPPISTRPSDERVWLCYYDGDFYDFAKGPPPGVDGKTVEWRYVRLSVRVYADGTAELDGAGISQDDEPTGPTS